MRTIFCIDLDAFFVSVERLKRPELVGRPVVVGGRGGRGVVCAASYEVRKFGVRSAMASSEAERRLRGVPDVVWLSPSHGEYGEHSARVRAVIEAELPVVEAASIDEFYGDATGLFGTGPGSGLPVAGMVGGRRDSLRARAAGPLALAEHIALRIRADCGLPASIGIASSRLVAKIATDDAKPSGALYVAPGREAAYLDGLPIERIPGIGIKTAPHLHRIGIREIGDVGRTPAIALESALGAPGAAWLREAAAGRDESAVAEREGARSIGHEETFDRDVAKAEELEAIATDLADRVGFRLRAESLEARTVQVKLRYSARRRKFVEGLAARDVYETITRAGTGPATSDGREIAARARALLRAHWRAGEPVRLLGVSCSHLEVAGGAPRQRLLFEDDRPAANPRSERLNRTLDDLRGRFGFEAISWGSAIRRDGS